MKKYIAEVVFLLAAISLILVFAIRPPEPKPEKVPEPEPLPIPEPVLLFGLPVDSFTVETAPILRNENLSDILVKKNISYQTIDQLARKSKPIFDVRRIKHNNHYHFFLKNDSLQTPAYFVYEIDNTDYVVYELQDSLHIYTGQKPITTELKTASGTIKSSLWNTMQDNDINPVLAIKLSDIYQWTIDFYGIQRNDQFRVIYEEMYVDSISIGVGEIYACQFQHMNQDFYAFQFEQDSSLSYFDQEGNSLKKAFLKSPLEFSRISSRFSNSRYHPVLKIRRPHHGIDYAAPTGTPVRTIGDGVVTRKGYQRAGGGNYLYIKHNSVYTTCYMHLHGFAKGIATGTRVKQGQVIGYVGSTGLSTGPHLDFRVFRNGSPMDPLKVEAPPVEPIHEDNLTAFTTLKDSLTTQLSLIPFQE
ncbi:M23 family metallopeptidase [Sunxiuqinia dokdonensis]|uniref:Peptidase M23 n=1 Tax=Sunxiuqinia dokdonensis TaxID=1409788 RepID=A0A0L8VBG8_9BACT|nr:M23 family metallopeptidase [Sunxiuqinia dokdonensis]KOH45532.1 peptidase M23 [Sunxiuqinia dokdonensis]